MLKLSTQSGAHPQADRGADLYETPAVAVQAILRAESLPHHIWEPAGGRGAIVRELRAAGHAVIVSDLIDYGFPLHFVGDFLTQTRAPVGCQAICTNPPYDRRILNRFVAHALDLCPRVIMLVRLAFLEGTARTDILENRGLARVHVFRDRLPMMHRDGWAGRRSTSAVPYCWCVWDRNHRGPFTVNRINANTGNGRAGSRSPKQGDKTMTKPTPHVVTESDVPLDPPVTPVAQDEQLDAEEAEFRKLRRDLPGVKGAAAAGIVAISVAKAPTKNEFFRTHKDPDFRPIMPIVDVEVGMEKQFFAVTPDMVEPLGAIGISVTDAVLYLTVTSRGAYRIVPVRCANADGDMNEYARTKELSLIQAMDGWVRLFTDLENRCYKIFPAPIGRFGEPQWPDLKPAKVFRLAFRDKGRLIDSTHHPLFMKWAARDAD